MIIKQGTHYARPLQLLKKLFGIRFCKKRVMTCTVEFNNSAVYFIGKDQSDINKLFGFSLGYHHTNSLRVGWRYVPDKGSIEIVSYVYDSKNRLKEKHIDWLDFKVRKTYFIVLHDNLFYEFGYKVNGVSVKVAEGLLEIERKRYFSYPLSLYFGGNCEAPHDIVLDTYLPEY